MLNAFFHKVRLALTDSEIRVRILFLAGALVVFRLLASVPIPGVNRFALENFFANNQFFGLLNIFSGGGLSRLSIVMLGVGPYITASIVMQVATIIFPNIKRAYQEEGEAGRARFISWSRLLTVPLAALQAIGFLFLLRSQGVLLPLSSVDLIANILLVTSGSLLLMWIGELITEFGIGNGVSLIIFAGIVARLPSAISQSALRCLNGEYPCLPRLPPPCARDDLCRRDRV
jgi:preprotein translocase subunit SecY